MTKQEVETMLDDFKTKVMAMYEEENKENEEPFQISEEVTSPVDTKEEVKPVDKQTN